MKQRGVGGQPARDRLAPASGFRLECGELVVEPVLQVVRQVGADDNAVAFPVLLVVGVEFDVGDRPVELELRDGQARQLVLPEPGEHQRLVDQGSLSTERFEPFPNFRPNVGDSLPLPLAPSHGQGFEQGSAAGDVEQSHQLGFGHRPASVGEGRPSRRLGETLERIRDQSPVRQRTSCRTR